MFSYIWHTFFFDPVYNTLVFFIDVIPGGDVGLAIIATVIVVKVILLPLSIKAAKTQRVMRELEPKLKEIKETHKDDREAQARAMMDTYKEGGINPFASIILLFIQIPIIIALYFSVFGLLTRNDGGTLIPTIDGELLYSFVPAPELTLESFNFLGVIDISEQSIILALLAGLTQFAHAQLAIPKMAPREPDAEPSMKDDFMRNMNTQMRYVMPAIIGVVAYTFSASIALYFIISNLMMIGQEYFVKKHR